MPKKTKTDNQPNRSYLLGSNVVREDGDEGTLTFPLSSEEPYRRWDGLEILDHSEDAVDLSFINSGSAPFMDSHDRWTGLDARLGVITKAWLENKRLYVTVKFSSRQQAQEVKQDIEDGILRNVSVGYEVQQTLRNEDDDEYRVTKWKPKEASMVLIPADETVGVGRSTQPKEGTMPKPNESQASSGDDVRNNQVMPGLETPTEMTDEQRGEALEEATNEITALAAEHNMSDLARQFIGGALSRGDVPSVAVFKGLVRAKLPSHVPLRNEDIGLNPDETRQFSLSRFILGTREGATPAEMEAAAFEREAVEAAGEGNRGQFSLPAELMRHWNDYRDADGNLSINMTRAAMDTGTHTNVQSTDHLAGRFFEALRDRMVLGRLGMTMFTGLEGNIEFPGQDTVISAAWLASEDADVAESTPTYRKVSMAIRDLGAYTDLTRRMLMQSTIDVEMDVRNQLLNAMAAAIDTAGLYGSGASGQPTGVANTSGIGSQDFGTLGAMPDRDDLLDMRGTIAGTNKVGSPVFVGDSAMATHLMKTKVDAGSGKFLMDAANERLEIGNRYEETNMTTAGDLFAGVWDDLIMGTWGSLELDRSTEAKFLSGGLRLRAIQSVDFGVRRVGSFVLGNDGGS